MMATLALNWSSVVTLGCETSMMLRSVLANIQINSVESTSPSRSAFPRMTVIIVGNKGTREPEGMWLI
jgi:hypothetical protein